MEIMLKAIILTISGLGLSALGFLLLFIFIGTFRCKPPPKRNLPEEFEPYDRLEGGKTSSGGID